MGRRPNHLLVVAGTGTEVGKTWVAGRLAAALRRNGLTVAARKPAQSFEDEDPIGSTDAALLAAATGEDPVVVCPESRWYPVAMAPPMAADALGRDRIRVGDLIDELASSWSDGHIDLGVVELAGGLWSPIAHDGDCLDLTSALAPDSVLLVADAGLGTLNSVRPAVAALSELAPTSVFLNRFDDDVELHRRNAEWLRRNDGIDTIVSVEALMRATLDRPIA